MEKDGDDRRRNAGERASERAKGEERGWGEEGEREKGRAWLPLGDKWPSTDGRHIQIAPRCRCPASFYVCVPSPLSRIIPHVAFSSSRANDLLAKYSGKRRRVPSFSNEYFDTGDASDVGPSPVTRCLYL